MSAERGNVISEAECAAYGFGPAHPQHPRYNEIYNEQGQPRDVEQLMASLQPVPRAAGRAALTLVGEAAA